MAPTSNGSKAVKRPMQTTLSMTGALASGTASKLAASASSHAPATMCRRCSGNTLVDLGPLIQATIKQRPSASIRSPYVADVVLEGLEGSVLVRRAAAIA